MRPILSRLALLLLLPACGCAVAATDALIEANANTEKRAQFTRRFEATNRARATDGLLLLDECSERYWFERGWARKDRACAERIRRYENGDTTALNPPGAALATTRATVPDSVQRHYDALDKAERTRRWKYEGGGAPR